MKVRRVKAKLRDDRCEPPGPTRPGPRKIRVLTVVDTFSRFSPVLDPRFAYRGEDVVQTLERSCAVVGYPKTTRVDLGSEFISGTWTYGPTPGVSCRTSAGQANRPTTPSSKP